MHGAGRELTSLCHCLQTPVNYTDTCNVADPSEVEASVTPPPAMAQGVFANGDKAPPQTPPPVTDGTCNKYLPNDSTFNRYIWVARHAPDPECAMVESTRSYVGRALLSTVTGGTCYGYLSSIHLRRLCCQICTGLDQITASKQQYPTPENVGSPVYCGSLTLAHMQVLCQPGLLRGAGPPVPEGRPRGQHHGQERLCGQLGQPGQEHGR